MRIKIRNWDHYFEQDRSRQWKNIRWVPIPNKQGVGYKKIMAEKNGPEIFGCWIAIVEQGSLCNPRGDLSKYTIDEIAILTLIDINVIKMSIEYLSKKLDWLEVVDINSDINNLDKNVKMNDISLHPRGDDCSILFNSILCNSSEEGVQGGEQAHILYERFKKAYPLNCSAINPDVENWFILRAGEKFTDFEKVVKAAEAYTVFWKETEPDLYPYCPMMKQAIKWLREKQYEIDWAAKLVAEQKYREKKKNDGVPAWKKGVL